MTTIPDSLHYTKEHEWIRVEGDVATIGITDYAQGELGDIVYVTLPNKGNEVRQMAAFGTVEAVKTVSDLYAPVSGTIIDVNAALNDAPDSVNKSPYEAGWMIKVKMSAPAELEGLLSSAAYKELIGS
ncbi:MAG TPA: glycine cleavage system protein GcvH [Candidatus Eisenbacteria bacterium]